MPLFHSSVKKLVALALTSSSFALHRATAQDSATPFLVEIGTIQAQMKYDTSEFTVPPGVPVKLVLKNADDLPHNLVVCDREGVSLAVAQVAWELGEKGFEKQWIPEDERILAATGMVDPQQSAAVTFQSPKKEGRYDFVCTYPGHAVIMKGVMIVREGGPEKAAEPRNAQGPIKDLTYTLFKGSWDKMPDFAALEPEETDSIASGQIDLAVRGELSSDFAIVYEGIITAPEAGEFTFAVASDDGSQIFVDDELIVNNDGIHAHGEKKGIVTLTAGEHRLRLNYFERAGEESLEARWAGPGLKGRATRLSKRAPRPTNSSLITGIPLIPKDRPVIYRNFIEGAGDRAIAVGFPGGVSLAFDANQVRLALMWTGDFMDAARHWNGRGQGYQPPSGKDVIPLPPGEGFATLASPDAPWPEPAPRAVDSRFKGYRFWDPNGNPEFLYQINGSVDVVDRCVPVTGDDGQLSLQRTITLQGKPEAPQLYFRVATGQIASEKNSTYLTAAGQRISITGADSTLQGGNLIIPVAFSDSSASFGITYQWLSKTETTPQ
ncbi:MAG: hypothetical protein KDN22_14960 [Verrucomicrobiae bacterium]|nr:hypothetical protein [Verrucomicrobiae bacterium]